MKTTGLMLAGCALLLAGCATPRLQRAFEQQALQNADRAAFIRGVPVFPASQPENEIASLSSVLRFWNRKFDARTIEWMSLQEPSVRIPLPALADSLGPLYGLWAHAESMPMAALKIRLKGGFPVIVSLQTRPLDPVSKWQVVVIGYDDLSQTVFLLDGSAQGIVMDVPTFLKKWSGQRFSTLLVCPPESPTWPLNGSEHFSRAQYYEKTKQFDRALNDYTAALEAGWAPLECRLGIGQVHLATGGLREAESWYRQALADGGVSATAYNNLAFVLAEQSSHLDEAERLARQATALEPSSPHYLDTLGYVFYQKGDYKEAARLLEKARHKAMNHPLEVRETIALRLASAYDRNGEPHLALQVIREAQRDHPGLRLPPELEQVLGKQKP